MTSPTPPQTYDVAVLGGGPAGSIAATRLAQLGRRVVLFERDRFPRFHIGESLLSTVNDVFAQVGLTDQVRAAGFPEKWGATFATWDGGFSRYADFSAAASELAQPQTWQVERAKLDEMLLRHAAASGAEVREEHRVLHVAFDAAGVEVSARHEGSGETASVRAAAVVDASGRAGLLARQLDLRRPDPQLANVSVYAHFRGVERLTGRRAGDVRIVARRDAGWYWLIPVDAELMSVGAVLPQSLFAALPRGSHEAMLEAAIADSPLMVELMRQAELAWPARVEKEFSYEATSYAGDRFVLCGDAGSFLDPVFSSGVAVALESGLEAADSLHTALARGGPTAARLAGFSRRQRARYRAFRRFVVGFYSPEFRDLFFQPGPGNPLFAAVVTILAGNWRPRRRTRLLVELFFLLVRVQRRFALAPRIYPAGLAAAHGAAR